MQTGIYKTENGSTVKISGNHSGIAEVDFDWFEEEACADCKCEAYPQWFGPFDWRLVWYCDQCGGGNARLKREETK